MKRSEKVEKKSKKSILIVITSLFLIMLILLGLTYAYYRTRIIGNESTNPSISVSSKNMEIVYEDGTSEMNMTGKIEPGFTASKTFFVKNTGNETVKYSVILDEMTNDFDRNQDWQVTLTKNGTSVISTDDNKYLAVGTHQILLPSESIVASGTDESTTDTYVLTVKYLNSEEDQSEDMGRQLSFKVNVSEEQYTWGDAPEGSLLNALKNNQPSGSETTVPGQVESTANEARILTTEDDYGTSYVYRGAVDNNYVNYSGMCWRIVRVQGDGTIKLVLADEKGKCNAETYSTNNKQTALINDNSSYVYSEHISSNNYGVYSSSNIPEVLSTWMNKEIKDTEGTLVRNKNLDTSKLVMTNWCNDLSISSTYSYGYTEDGEIVEDKNLSYREWTTQIYYGAYKRLYNDNATNNNPTLKCNMKGLNDSKALRYKSSIGLLTADEAAFAGVTDGYRGDNSNYLFTNAKNAGKYGYYWLMSPSDRYDIEYRGGQGYNCLMSNGSFSRHYEYEHAIRPAIVLRNDVIILPGGNGTYTNPYEIQ